MKEGLRIATLLSVLFFCNVICDSENATTFVSEHEKQSTEVNHNQLSESSDKVDLNSEENVLENDYGLSADDVSISTNMLSKNFVFDKITNNVDDNRTTRKVEKPKENDMKQNGLFKIKNQAQTNKDDNDTVYEIRRRILNIFPRPQNDTTGTRLNSTMSSTANQFYCSIADEHETQLILYGAKAWTFPLQDVNLTLSYPTAKSNAVLDTEEQQSYIITGFSVVLNIDGAQTRGYITSGGIFKEHISMTFINTAITSLTYKFWLYGFPKEDAHIDPERSMNYFC